MVPQAQVTGPAEPIYGEGLVMESNVMKILVRGKQVIGMDGPWSLSTLTVEQEAELRARPDYEWLVEHGWLPREKG